VRFSTLARARALASVLENATGTITHTDETDKKACRETRAEFRFQRGSTTYGLRLRGLEAI